jgi:hypothetical protein
MLYNACNVPTNEYAMILVNYIIGSKVGDPHGGTIEHTKVVIIQGSLLH